MMNEAEFANIAAAEEQMWWFRGMRSITAALLDSAPLPPHPRALDLGCGAGYNAQWLARRYGATVAAADLSETGLRWASRRGVPRLARADALLLPFPSAAFDFVASFDMMVHFHPGDELTAVGEMARVLKPGGLLFLRAAAFDWLRSRHSEFVAERQRYSRAKIARLLQESGLKPLRATYANTLLLPVALAKFRLWEPLFQPRPASGVATPSPLLNRLLAATLEFEAVCLRRGFNLPIGQSFAVLAEKPA